MKTAINWRLLSIWLLIATAVVIAVIPYFVIPRSHCPGPNNCINNLRQLEGAVLQWAIEQRKEASDKVTFNDITPYLKNPSTCPQAGTYTVGPVVSNLPTCSIAGHVLPQP